MRRTDVLLRTAWIGLTLVGLFFLTAPVLDIVGTHGSGVPADHAATFRRLSGSEFSTLRTSEPGVARYVSTLEYGYALHELTFGLLFLAVVVFGIRTRRRWAWFACWAVMVASIGYSATFGAHDPVILGRSLVAVVAVPLLLLLAVPAVFRTAPEPTAVRPEFSGVGY
jgi:hypothetical protein